MAILTRKSTPRSRQINRFSNSTDRSLNRRRRRQIHNKPPRLHHSLLPVQPSSSFRSEGIQQFTCMRNQVIRLIRLEKETSVQGIRGNNSELLMTVLLIWMRHAVSSKRFNYWPVWNYFNTLIQARQALSSTPFSSRYTQFMQLSLSLNTSANIYTI